MAVAQALSVWYARIPRPRPGTRGQRAASAAWRCLHRPVFSGTYVAVLSEQGSHVGRAKVIDYDYYQFLGLLRRATNAGARIEKNQPGWAEYIKTHGINEIAASAIARQKLDKGAAVIINEGKDTDGLYFYSKDDEACLRLVSLPE